jgi:hypothetical protein
VQVLHSLRGSKVAGRQRLTGKRSWVGAFAFPVLILSILQNRAGQENTPVTSSRDARISVDVNLVVLHATVPDRRGQPVSGLQQQDFEVYEDGARQRLEPTLL